MKKIRKWIKMDQYGVVRGTLLLGIVMLLCTYMVIRLFYSYDLISEHERAAQATKNVAIQFDQYMENSLLQLTGAAALMDEDVLQSDDIFDSLLKIGSFSKVGVIKDGVLTHSSGKTVDEIDHSEHNHYITDNSEAEIHIDDQEQIHICAPLKDGSRFIGWVNQEKIESILCNAFVEDYGYAVYNAASGEFFINRTEMNNPDYFDALREFNQDSVVEKLVNSGEAQVRVRRNNADGGDIYIAQQISNVRPLGIVLMLPEELVQSEATSGRIMPHATMLAALLMLVILITYTAYSLRRVYISNKDSELALATGERMMDVISREAKITLFIYQRKHDRLANCYDGLSLLKSDTDIRRQTLAEIEQACGMDDSEAERLNNSLRNLEPGESTELLVRNISESQDERILRFTMFASSQADQETICCISDCTQEQASLDRIELERSYQASVQQKTSSILQINISRNRWKVLHAKPHSSLHSFKTDQSGWRDYNADLGSLLRDYLHPADYPDIAETMSIVSIASIFRSGKTEIERDYRICRSGGADYEWHRMCARIWLNPETNDIYANLYVFNVNAEKNAELERGERKKILNQTLTALGGLYYGLYYVDLENDLTYTARSLGGDLVTQLCSPFKATFDGYIDSTVHPDDREALRTLLSAYQLRKRMTEGSHFLRKEYRRKSGDSYKQAAIIVQPARFENGIVKEVVLAIRYLKREQESEM